MKKLILIFVMLIGFFSFPIVKAQTSVGSMLIGLSSGFNITSGSDLMSIGFSSTKYKSNASGFIEPDPDKTTNLNLMPKFGVFIVNNLAVGLDVVGAYSQYKSGESSFKYTTTLLAVGPFMRYYIHLNKVFPFFEGSATFGSRKFKYEYISGSDESKDALISFGGGIGIAAPLSDKVTFDVMVDYTSLNLKAKNDNPDDERTVTGSIGIKLGFIVFLGTR